jgi:hypothetical protein
MEKKTSPQSAVDTVGAPLPAERAFVVQFRAPADVGGDVFVGRVEHIASGTTARFGSAEELITFITRVLVPGSPDSGPSRPSAQGKETA